MSTHANATAQSLCPVVMSDGKPCGRLIHPAPPGVDPKPVCLIHSRDPEKDKALFRQEIDAILAGKSIYNRPKDTFDFTQFIFPEANFLGATFTQNANFRAATFTQGDYFIRATFTQNAYFIRAKFTQNADFRSATFTERGYFFLTSFRQVADFRAATFEKPNRILFHRVNEEPPPGMAAPVGMKARFLNCLLDGVRFEDVHWYTPGGRLVLQDELDLEGNPPPTHELVADAYRRLVNNFEKARQYELAEQCVVGEMEMRRLNPATPPPARFVTYLYRELSFYGSNYFLAFRVLCLLLVLFAVLFSWAGLSPSEELRPRPTPPADTASLPLNCEPEPSGKNLRELDIPPLHLTLIAGLLQSFEVATFRRDRSYEPLTLMGRALIPLEQIFVPAQAALFLLALRRRFRR